jgi:hypothetical protein
MLVSGTHKVKVFFWSSLFVVVRSSHILTLPLADDEWSTDMTHNPCHWRPALSKGYADMTAAFLPPYYLIINMS